MQLRFGRQKSGGVTRRPPNRSCPVLEGAALPRRNKGSMEPALPQRKHPAHRPLIATGNLSPIIFLTVCTKDRKPFLARPEVQSSLISAWQQARQWRVGRYLVMPDHLHLFCRPACHDAENIRAWMRYWKALVTRTWLCPSEKPLWQQDGWDTQLRRGKSYQSKWEYVRLNPVRARLVTAPEDWPFQGELNSLAWHES